MNVVSEVVITLFNLKVKPHPKPFKVACVNNTTLLVIEKFFILIQLGDYKDKKFL